MITYNAYSEAMPELDTTATTAWIARVAEKHGKRIGNVNYIFCTDDEILDVNRQYLRHDYYTDIITFDYCAHGILSGDIYISLDTVASNAEELQKDPVEELHRVLIHGILHLVGINDKGPGELEIMEHAEDEALAMR